MRWGVSDDATGKKSQVRGRDNGTKARVDEYGDDGDNDDVLVGDGLSFFFGRGSLKVGKSVGRRITGYKRTSKTLGTTLSCSWVSTYHDGQSPLRGAGIEET